MTTTFIATLWLLLAATAAAAEPYKALAPLIGLAFIVSIGSANAQDAGKKVISTPNAPEAIGPYSQAIRVGNTVYLAGQIAIDPKTKQVMANTSIEDQTRLVLENIRAVLVADGLTMDHIVTTTVFLKDLNEFGRMNEVYATFFKERAARPCNYRGRPPPARREDRDFGNRRASVVLCLRWPGSRRTIAAVPAAPTNVRSWGRTDSKRTCRHGRV